MDRACHIEEELEEIHLKAEQSPDQYVIVGQQRVPRGAGWVELNIDFTLPVILKQNKPNLPASYTLHGSISKPCRNELVIVGAPIYIIEEQREVEAK